jgi:predicted permease
MVARVVDKLFRGSPEQLIAQLVENEKLSVGDLKRLRGAGAIGATLVWPIKELDDRSMRRAPRPASGSPFMIASSVVRRLARLLEDLTRDFSYGARALRRNVVLTAVTVGILAVGLGANATIFRFVSALLLQPPPVLEPSELLEIWNLNAAAKSPFERYHPLSYPDYAYFRDHNRSFSGLLAFDGDPNTVSWMRGGHGEMAQAQYVSGNYFTVLGMRPALGTTALSPDDGSSSGSPAVVISNRFWRDRLGGDSAVVGSAITLNGVIVTVAGVAPSGFAGLLAGISPDVWVPLSASGAVRHDRDILRTRTTFWLFGVGRLRPGVVETQARSELDVLSRQAASSFRPSAPERNGGEQIAFKVAAFPVTLVPGPFRLPVGAFVALFQVVVALILVIACANAANLFLAQAARRRPEMALRSSLGATRRRLVQLVLAQTVLVGGLAGIAGLLIAREAAPLFLRLIPPGLPIRLDLAADWRVVAFGVALALAAGVLFGLAPALRGTSNLAIALRSDATSGRPGSRLRNALVVTQVAVSLVLLVSGALCLQSLMRAQHVNPGFSLTGRVAAQVDLGSLGYGQREGKLLQQRLVQRVASMPAVRHVSTTQYLPLATTQTVLDVKVEGKELGVQVFDVGDEYFKTMGTPILQGREFAASDDERASHVAIVNEAFARRVWGGGTALGKLLSLRIGDGGPEASYQVVGVVATGKYRSLSESPKPVLFRAQGQSYHPRLTLVADIDGAPPAQALAAIRGEVAALDPNLVVLTETLEQHLAFALFPARATGMALSVAGVLGLLLALGGMAAVIAQSIAQRTREIGIRMALGAGQSEILRQIIGEGGRLLAIGIGIGTVIGLGATRLLSGVLYGISASDPATFVGVIVLLAGSALGACALVARQATTVDPLVAIRSD